MQKNLLLVVCSIFVYTQMSASVFEGRKANKLFEGATKVRIETDQPIATYIEFRQEKEVERELIEQKLASILKLGSDDELILFNEFEDQLGHVHFRYKQMHKTHILEGAVWTLHTSNGKVYSMNGELYNNLDLPAAPIISESFALQKALHDIGANQYKWQISLI